MTEILIVDDEPDIRMLIEAILRDEGFEARSAGTSDEAIAAYRARRPGLVILDVWLQGSKLDGIGILEVLHQEQPRVPVVMISGHGTIETAVAAIQRGAYDFIEQPFNSDRLLLVVRIEGLFDKVIGAAPWKPRSWRPKMPNCACAWAMKQP
jgi:two-component system nitrogen regulation response regulator NtrX